MSTQRHVAMCATGTRPRLGFGETAVIIVIIVMAVIMALRGTRLPEVAAVLTSAGLLAVIVVRLGQAGVPRGTALRSAGRALLSPGQV
ncbi:hypothetical protein [Streptomyces sp. NPDC001820]|uniref:hypothetical protein n=1 Tax=Streptomyces sp. NPDC001820 TaxID=3364613 RepID=UPI0036C422F0